MERLECEDFPGRKKTPGNPRPVVIRIGANVFEIDADLCTECVEEGEPQCVPVCPGDCIAKPA